VEVSFFGGGDVFTPENLWVGVFDTPNLGIFWGFFGDFLTSRGRQPACTRTATGVATSRARGG